MRKVSQNDINSQILNEVQLFFVLESLPLKKGKTAWHGQLLTVCPVIIHFTHVVWIPP